MNYESGASIRHLAVATQQPVKNNKTWEIENRLSSVPSEARNVSRQHLWAITQLPGIENEL